MKLIEKEKNASCRITPKKPRTVSSGASLIKAAKPSFEERQIVQLEETFTDRWEW